MNRKIDIFIDIHNDNNVWGLITTTIPGKLFARKEERIERFRNKQEMGEYLINFGPNFSIHKVDYGSIVHYYHKGVPELDYFKLKYYEYINNVRTPKEEEFSVAYEDTFVEILKVSKGIPLYEKLDSHSSIDVYAVDKEARRARAAKIKETFKKTGQVVKNKILTPRGIRNLILFVAVIAVIKTGYNFLKKNEDDSEFLIQHGGLQDLDDYNIFLNKGRIGVLTQKLLEEDYGEITDENIEDVIKFHTMIAAGNHDHNSSHNTYNYSNYIKYKIKIDPHLAATSDRVLEKIKSLYNNCFVQVGDEYLTSSAGVNAYVNYVASLVAMYDTYHDTRNSTVKVSNQSVASNYATPEEISAFDNYPPMLRFIILLDFLIVFS